MSDLRPINKAVGLSPKLGSLSIYQVAVMVGLAIPMYYLKELNSLPMIPIALIWGFISGLFLLIIGDRPWLFINRISRCPYTIRAGAYYYPLLAQEEEYLVSLSKHKCKTNHR